MTVEKLEELGLSSSHPCEDSSSTMQYDYLDGLDDLEKGLILDDPSRGGDRLGYPVVAGEVEVFQNYAEEMGGVVGDTGALSRRDKAPIIEVRDSPEPLDKRKRDLLEQRSQVVVPVSGGIGAPFLGNCYKGVS